MKITITINTDNAAFEDRKFMEMTRILREASQFARYSGEHAGSMSLRDSNGNTVGRVTVEDEA